MFDIRDMMREDAPDVVSIITSHEETDGAFARRYYDEFFDEAEGDPREQSVVAILDQTDRIAGVSGWYRDKYDWPGILWLNWTYVHTEYRGRGVGTALVQFVIDRVLDLETRKLYVDTSSDRGYGAAVRLYEKFGFREEGRLTDYYEKGEDFLILGLDLSVTERGEPA